MDSSFALLFPLLYISLVQHFYCEYYMASFVVRYENSGLFRSQASVTAQAAMLFSIYEHIAITSA
jgi:hypothetical protein